MTKALPILSLKETYQRSFIRGDILAGVTVAALVVPKNLGYAEIAGVPIENGLYAAAAGAILYAIFGTSRQISTGPSSGLAAVAGSAVIAAGVAPVTQAAALVAAIAIVAGLLFVLMSILRMGWISQFISKAVITGFLFGAAIDVVVGELSKITGTDADGSNAWRELWSWVSGLGDTHSTTLAVGIASLVALFGMHALSPHLPGELIVVAAGIFFSRLFGLDQRGVALVGEVPRGLPSLAVPSWDLVSDHAGLILLAAVAIVLIGFSQSAGDARFFAAKHDYRVDIDQESLAQGVANIGSGLFQGIPVATSLSASSLNDRAGARSQFASLATGGTIILTLIFLAPLFSDLPKAVLGAVVIEAVTLGMMDVPAMRRLYRVKRSDFWIALAALTGVVTFGVLAGVLVGVMLSILWLLKVVTSPSVSLLGLAKGTHVFRDLEAHPDSTQLPGIVAVRLEGALFFVTADSFEDRVHTLVEEAPVDVRLVVLDFQSVNFIDSQGAAKLDRIAQFLTERGIALRLARVKPLVMDILIRDGIVQAIGEESFFLDVFEAVHDASSTEIGHVPQDP
ncbi:MAG: sulfate permease [Thermomicrobiales bacterium]